MISKCVAVILLACSIVQASAKSLGDPSELVVEDVNPSPLLDVETDNLPVLTTESYNRQGRQFEYGFLGLRGYADDSHNPGYLKHSSGYGYPPVYGYNQCPYGHNHPDHSHGHYGHGNNNGYWPYGQGPYGQGQYGPGQYGPGQYGPGQYGQGHYGPGQYSQGHGNYDPGHGPYGPGSGGHNTTSSGQTTSTTGYTRTTNPATNYQTKAKVLSTLPSLFASATTFDLPQLQELTADDLKFEYLKKGETVTKNKETTRQSDSEETSSESDEDEDCLCKKKKKKSPLPLVEKP